ncbi:MAG: hypothetical protein AMXMBFR53_30100 [Gemmatimonadota bacterium]
MSETSQEGQRTVASLVEELQKFPPDAAVKPVLHGVVPYYRRRLKHQPDVTVVYCRRPDGSVVRIALEGDAHKVLVSGKSYTMEFGI